MDAPQTIFRMFRESADLHAGRVAIRRKEGQSETVLSYADLLRRALAFRRSLAMRGVGRGDRVAILSYNRPEWAIADLAAQGLGAVTVPIYHTLPSPQVAFLLRDSGAKLAVVEDAKQLAKVAAARSELPDLETVVLVEGVAEGALSFSAMSDRSDKSSSSDADLDALEAAIQPEDTATLIYTSGTTGDPKGAMLSHRALLHTGQVAREFVPLSCEDVFLSFLPLCHVIERVGGHYLPLMLGASIYYSEGPFAVAREMREVKPTLFLCVPRLFESIEEKVREEAAKQREKRRRVFEWALGVGMRVAERRDSGRGASLLDRLQLFIAEKLVLGKVRDKVSGGRMRFFVAGGAPLARSTALFFQALGLTILEGYGLTEIPVVALNRPNRRRIGTVGPPIPGIELKIAEDGEILARGPSLMQGYFKRPEATAEAIGQDGWFRTGDVGETTPDGLLRITDRKKDIIVLANGKNVAPQPIEAALKRSRFIADLVLIGDRQAGLSALVSPALDEVKRWARECDLPVADIPALLKRAETRKRIKEEIDLHSQDLADFERVKRFAIVEQPFTIEGGELTPTLKVRRKFVAEKYADTLAALGR